MPVILIAEDDAVIRTTQKCFLESEGYNVLEAADGKSAITAVRKGEPDTILLDIVLGKDNGIELIADIRKYTDAPIIMVSGKKDLVDKVLALEMGADDYMCKPVEMRELSSRVKANVRRYNGLGRRQTYTDAPPPVRCGKWTINFSTYTVSADDGTDAGLTTAEFELLAALARAPNIVFSRDKLFDMLKADNYESFDRAIDVLIARIRKKMGDHAHKSTIIKTVRNVGYTFIGVEKK